MSKNDDFDFNDNDAFGDDDDLFSDSDTDSTGIEDEVKQETAAERDTRIEEREKIRAEMGWKIPSYNDIIDELDELEPKLATLTADFKKLKADGKEDSSEAREIKNKVKRIRTLQQQVKTIEEHVDSILRDPSNFDNIIDYGSNVTSGLGALAEKIITIQAASDNDFNVFNGTMAQVKAVINDDGVKGALALFKDAAFGLGKKAGETGKEVGNVGTGIVKKSWKTLFGGKRAKDEKQIEEDREMENALLQALPEKHQTIKQAAKVIEGLEGNLKKHAAQVNALGKENLKAVESLRLYIAAGDEIIRIYDEELIPKLVTAHEKEKSPTSERQLVAFESARSDFFDQLIDLEATMYRARRDVLKLAMQLETSKEQIKTVRKMRKNGVNQWMNTLADAILQGTTVMQNRVLLEHSDLGSELDDISVGLQEVGMKSQKALSESSLRQVDKLLENQKRLAKVLEEATDQKVTKNAKQLEAREKLATAEGELASLKSKSTKALADSREENRKALSGPDTTDTNKANDNADISDETADLVANVRRKRKGPKTPGQ